MEKITFAKINEAERIYELIKEEGKTAYTLDLVKDLINTEGSLSLILKNDKIIGALGARAEGKNSAWLYYIVIDRDYREKGYAKKLIDKLFEEARKKGIRRIALDTPEKEFFEKFGFKEVGRIPDWHENKDQVIMFKELY